VGAERAPRLGGVGTDAEALESVADAEIGREPGVGIGERAHGDVLGGPGTDARQGEQRRAGVGAGFESQAIGECPRQGGDGPLARTGHRQRGRGRDDGLG
jgi:hypothetical protein